MEFYENMELFNEPIIKDKNNKFSNHKIFLKYTTLPYQKYSFELIETLCNKSNLENKSKILHKSIYFLLKFLYKTRNNILISNYDIILLISFYLGIKTVENQKKIPKITKLKNIYKEKFGEYKNEELQLAEIIFLKLLEYKINFMTAYDYLCYLFQNNEEFMKIPKINLEIIIRESTQDFCTKAPILIIQECLKKVENNKLLKCPIIKKKIIQQKNKNIFLNELGKNFDSSLSTSISSGCYYNNNQNTDIKTNYSNHIEIEKKIFPIENIINKYIVISPKKSGEGNCFNYKCCLSNENYQRNITINNTIVDYEKLCDNISYKKKNVKNLKKNKNGININKNDKNTFIFKTNIKDKLFQRNNIPVNKLKLNYTNNNNYNSPNKNIYSKPCFKKIEGKIYFTSNKKKENDNKFKFYNRFNKNKLDGEDFRCSLKKKLLFDEDDD